jgi:essential nuclear protein 1
MAKRNLMSKSNGSSGKSKSTGNNNTQRGKLQNVRITKTKRFDKNKKGKFNFRNNRKNIRSVKSERKANKDKIKKSNLQKHEEEIQEIENENELFYNTEGYEEVNEEEWGDVDATSHSTNTMTLSNLLLQKMNEVEEKKLDPRIEHTYRLLGDILQKYTSGRLPKAFNILPVTENWEDLIELTQPNNWSPQAMYEGTVMFCSNLNAMLAEKFYAKVLLPAVRSDIKKNGKLNIHFYKCLKKAIFKPSAFFKGIIIPLSDSTSAKEASIIGSIVKKCSIPVTHSSACIMKLIDKCSNKLSMGALFFMKMLLLKKYALPTPVKEALVKFFVKFNDYTTVLPVLWHQTLLIFVQIYKLDLTDEEKGNLKLLVNKQNHHLITEDIVRELNYKPVQTSFFTGNANNNKTNTMIMD